MITSDLKNLKRKACEKQHGKKNCNKNGNAIGQETVNAPVENTNPIKKNEKEKAKQHFKLIFTILHKYFP